MNKELEYLKEINRKLAWITFIIVFWFIISFF